MSKRLDENLGSVEYDGLIAANEPVADVFSVTIRKLGTAATLKRGTVLALSSADSKMVILGTAADESSQAFNGDGTTKKFTVTAKPLVIKTVKVGGNAVTVSTYDASTGVVELASAPASGTNNVVVYYAEEKLAANCVLCDDVDVGTAADVTALAYRTGHFARDKMVVAAEYTMTAADEQALRESGILLSDAIAI